MMNSNSYYPNAGNYNYNNYQPNYGYNGYDPNQPFVTQPMTYNQYTMSMENALTAEEIERLRQKPQTGIDFTLTEEEVLRNTCCHRLPNQQVLTIANDGSGDFICTLCGTKFPSTVHSTEEVTDACKVLTDACNSMKCLGNVPTSVVRDAMSYNMGFINKLPAAYDISIKNADRAYQTGQMGYAPEAQNIGMLRSITGQAPVGYGYVGNPYMNQNPYQQPMMNQPYQAQPMNNPYMPQGQTANPNVNPMQAPYGVDPNAQNQQFVNQANTMMPGTTYVNPYMPQQGQAPYQQPMMNQPYQAQPMNNPYMPQQGQTANVPGQQPMAMPQQQAQQVAGSTVSAPDATGTVTSESKIDL